MIEYPGYPVGNETMALLLQTRYALSVCSPRYPYHFPNPYYRNPFLIIPTKSLSSFHASPIAFSAHPTPSRGSPPSPTASAFHREPPPQTPPIKVVADLAASTLLFLCIGVRLCLASSPPSPLPAGPPVVQEDQTVQGF